MKNLKKIFAMVLVVAMVFSLASIGVYADDTLSTTVQFRAAADAAYTETIDGAKAGATVYADIYVPAAEYKSLAVSYGSAVSTISAEDITVNVDGSAVDPYNARDAVAQAKWTSKVVVPEGTPLMTIKIVIPDAQTVAADTVLVNNGKFSYNITAVSSGTAVDGTLDILDTMTTVQFRAAADAAYTETITSAKAGKTVYADIYVPAEEYKSLAVSYASKVSTISAEDITVNVDGSAVDPYNARDAVAQAKWTSKVVVPEGTPLMTIKIVIPADQTAAEDTVLVGDGKFSYNITTVKSGTAVDGVLDIMESFTATKAEPTSTDIPTSFEIGTDVVAAFADVDITVAPAEGDGEAGYKATWVADFDNTVPGDYEVVGTVIGPDDNKIATWEGDLTTTVNVTLTAIADGTLAEVAPVEMQATKEDAEVVVEAFDLAINKGDFADYITITADMIAVDNETIVTTAAGTFEDAVTITIPKDTASKGGKFVIAAETVVKGDVVITPAEFKYEEVSYEVSSDGKMEESSELTVTITNNQSEEDFKPEAKAVITVTLTYDGDKTATFVYGDDEGEEITFDADNKVAEITLPALGEMFKALGLDSFVGASVSVGVTYDDADVLPGEEAAPELDLEVEEDAPTSNKKPSGIGNNKRPSGNGGTVTPSTPDAPVDPENPETPVDPENPDVPAVTGTFADVPATHWAYEAIEKLAAAGIINGVGDGTFNVDGNVTRAEFAKMIVVAMGIEATATESAFEDCTADAWFTPYVVAAAEAGYVTGISETYFGADELISRQDICTILGRVLAVESEVAAEFIDADQIADYAVKYVNALVEMGIINGYEDGSFRPEANATRAEAAKIVNGVLDITAEEEAPVEEAATEEAVEEVAEEVVEAE